MLDIAGITCYTVSTMFIDTATYKRKTKSGTKTYTRHLLRRAYRDENGKPQKETIANLSHLSQNEINQLKLFFKFLSNLEKKNSNSHKNKKHPQFIDINSCDISQGPSYAISFVISVLANRLGLIKALGNSQQGKLAIF